MLSASAQSKHSYVENGGVLRFVMGSEAPKG